MDDPFGPGIIALLALLLAAIVRIADAAIPFLDEGEINRRAEENDAKLIVQDKGDVKTVAIMAKQAQPSGYAKIIIDYNKNGLPVRMLLDEFTGIETEYTFKN